VSRVLARFDRDQIASFISVAIDLLDTMDAPTDPEAPDFTPRTDALPGDPADAEPAGDDMGDVAWSEHHTRGRHKLVDRGSFQHEPMMRSDGPGMAQEDDEDDDPHEDNGDEQDTGNGEDEGLTGHALLFEDMSVGCPASDPGGGDREETLDGNCATFGIDQTRHVSEGEAFHDLNGIPLIRVPLPENDQ
jgi:hypothetical protein